MSQVRKDVLNGWKEIAAYLGRDTRTVERWEKQRFLPVRRLPGGGRASVYALVSELDAWLASPSREADVPPISSAPGASRGVEAAQAGDSDLPEPSTSTREVPSSQPLERPMERDSKPPLESAAGEALAALPRRRRRWLAAGALAIVLFGLLPWLYLRSRPHQPQSEGGEADAPRVRTLSPSSQVPGVEDLYLRGSYDAELRTPESLQEAQDAFSAAIHKDPGYAPAYSGLASTFLLLREYSLLADREAYNRAMQAADQALRLDPEFPQAHAVEGFVDFFWKWDRDAATREFTAAERLEPSLPLAHHWYGSMLTHEGRYGEALRELQTAQKLDPSSPAILTTRAYALGLSGHRTEGEDLLREAIRTERSGQFRWPATMHQVLGSLSLLPPRDLPRFLSESLLSADLRHDQQGVRTMRSGTVVYRAKGETAMWRALLSDEQRRSGPHTTTYAAARYKAALGENEEVLRDLKELYAIHDPAIIGMSIDPLFADLHGDRRFHALQQAVGLPTEE